jgi:hypothetical protein
VSEQPRLAGPGEHLVPHLHELRVAGPGSTSQQLIRVQYQCAQGLAQPDSLLMRVVLYRCACTHSLLPPPWPGHSYHLQLNLSTRLFSHQPTTTETSVRPERRMRRMRTSTLVCYEQTVRDARFQRGLFMDASIGLPLGLNGGFTSRVFGC